MTINKKFKILACILILFLFFYIIIFELFGYKNTLLNIENKKALIAIMDNLEVGVQREKVRDIFRQYRTKGLELIDQKETTWLIRMPYEFGARDWVLWIEFDDKGITNLKIRLSDNKEFKPKNSPDDKKW